jgi:hypothetical protein
VVAAAPRIRIRISWSDLMAALVLSVAGGAVGGAVFGPAGAIAGRLVGAIGGNLDRPRVVCLRTRSATSRARVSPIST